MASKTRLSKAGTHTLKEGNGNWDCPFLCTLKMDLRLQYRHWEIGKIVFNEWDFEKQYLGWKITFLPLHPRPPNYHHPRPSQLSGPSQILNE